MTLQFLGAARTVTGSKHLLEVNGRRVLVDCGLFQGLKELRERNWHPLPMRAPELQAVILKRPQLFATLIRQLEKLPDHAVLRIVREVRDGEW